MPAVTVVRVAALAAVLLLQAAASSPASANRIHTGGETGAYFKDFCPVLQQALAAGGATYTCVPSSGTRENLERVVASPRELGYGQFDVYALESGNLSSARSLEIVRHDDKRECVFAVTRNRDVTTYGELSANAPRLRFSLPPQTSGSAGTFQFLKYIDANGLGRARSTHAQTVEDAIRTALSRDDGVAMFVQFPDPDNERFKLVRELGGHFVPIIDRTILSQQVGGRDVYYAQETRITNPRTIESLSTRVTTACTPIVLFSGAADRIRGEAEKRAHTEFLNSIRRIPLDLLVPRESPWRQIGQRTRELTAEGRARMISMSQRTRDRALPFIERMIERAAPRFYSSEN